MGIHYVFAAIIATMSLLLSTGLLLASLAFGGML